MSMTFVAGFLRVRYFIYSQSIAKPKQLIGKNQIFSSMNNKRISSDKGLVNMYNALKYNNSWYSVTI